MRNTKYTTTEYISQVKHRQILPIGEYVSAHSKMEHLCLICNHTWVATPGAIRRGHGCPSCYQKSVRKPLEKVQSQLIGIGWTLENEDDYKNSYKRLTFKHTCGELATSNLDRILRGAKRCLICSPAPARKRWSFPIRVGQRSYASKLEMECCEYLIATFGSNDITLQKPYGLESRQTADAYIKSIDTYVEISSINKSFYLDRIFEKRQKVKNFVFVSSIEQIKLFF